MSFQKTTHHVTTTAKSTRKVQVTKTVQKTLPDGRVVTETFTEYKEVNDDSGFSGFGDQPKLTSTTLTSDSATLKSLESPKKSKSKSGSPSSSDDESAKAKKEKSSKKSSSSKGGEFAQQALDSHNAYRAKHGVAPLKLSKKLTAVAQEWADRLASTDKFEHRPNNKYGENIYMSWSSNPAATCDGDAPVQSWYSEISKYTFGSGGFSSGTGHFTQVVWKSSEKLGIALAKSKTNKIIVVANYDPPGNFAGKYAENVLPPKK